MWSAITFSEGLSRSAVWVSRPAALISVLEQVDLVVAVHMLQDGRQALQAHARVHARCGQRRDVALLVHVELHEHVVPDFDETVAIFIGRTGRATGNVRAVVVENFRARAAGAGVGHHPEVVGLVAPAFVVADADHALGGRPISLVQMSYASSSSAYTVASSLSAGNLYTSVSSSHAHFSDSRLK